LLFSLKAVTFCIGLAAGAWCCVTNDNVV